MSLTGGKAAAFSRLRDAMVRKKVMEGHTLSDTRDHFSKNTPKSAVRCTHFVAWTVARDRWP